MDTFAIYYEPSAYSLRGKVMGRQSAGASFVRAVANHSFDKLWCYSNVRSAAQDCARTLEELGSKRTKVEWIPLNQPQQLAKAGLLYRPDPGIQSDAWQRLTYANARSYSICGVTHTTASHAVMEAISNLPTAPLEHWDALICTSKSVRDSVRHLVESRVEYLRERTGATQFSLPQLPIIPLGVHTQNFIRSSEARESARNALNLSSNEVVVLFTGRLSFHGKAHPAPMYLGLEANAHAGKVVLIQAGWFANEAIERAFKADAAALCPSVRCLYVDGRDQARLQEAYAAADIFTSLSDNIQETFGLTPIEAMAAGLPVVVTDWDGYRDTVRNGVDGFRIPTLTLPPGRGGELADRYDLGVDDYDRYCAYASQLVGVDVSATTEAYRLLITDSNLRQHMGSAGARWAREQFDWSVIFRRYRDLWDDLAERRRSDAQLLPRLTRRRRPDRADPFTMFATYPTHHVGHGLHFRVRTDDALAIAKARGELATTSFAKPIVPGSEVLLPLLEAMGHDWIAYTDLSKRVPGARPEAVDAALVWLTKVGVIHYNAHPIG